MATKELSYRELQKALKPYKKEFGEALNLRADIKHLRKFLRVLDRREDRRTYNASNTINKFLRVRNTKLNQYVCKYSYAMNIRYKDDPDQRIYEETFEGVFYIRGANSENVRRVVEERLTETALVKDPSQYYPVEFLPHKLKMNISLDRNPEVKKLLHQRLRNAFVYIPMMLKHIDGISQSSYENHHNRCVYEIMWDYYKDIQRLTKRRDKPFSIEAMYEYFKKFNDDKYTMEDGVSPYMIQNFCCDYKIPCLGLDRDNNIVVRNVPENKCKFKPLYFYITNSHFYLIDSPKIQMSIRQGFNALKNETASSLFEEEKKEKTYNLRGVDSELEEIMNCEEGVFIMDNKRLGDILRDIINDYNVIPAVKYKTSKTLSEITLGKVRIQRYNGPVNMEVMDYKQMIEDNGLDFVNQGVGAFSSYCVDKFQNKRKYMTKEERQEIVHNQDGKCNICDGCLTKDYEIDHIEPFCLNYDNSHSNLQALCLECHQQKCEEERDTASYSRFQNFESHYNDQMKDLIKTDLFYTRAFIRQMSELPEDMSNFHYLDVRRCRTNCLLQTLKELPVYSSLDGIEPYQGDISKEGFYYVETKLDFPIAGNQFVPRHMVQYLLEQELIAERSIKYQYIPSLTVRTELFKKMKEEMTAESQMKLIMNSLIGTFGQKKREWFECSELSSNREELESLYIESQEFNENVHMFKVEDTDVYECLRKRTLHLDDNSLPLYYYILSQEAIEIHKMVQMIEQNGGTVYELNTDGVYYQGEQFDISDCLYPDGTMKYQFEQGKQLRGTYQRYYNYEKYRHEEFEYEEVKDISDGCFIQGRAGTGKSYIIKKFMKNNEDKNIVLLAPTNKASVNIGGITIDSFYRKNKRHMKRYIQTVDYIIVDEVSMMKEMFYSILLSLKRMNPDLKVILSGDFEQLPVVCDRINEGTDYYKNSRALFELVEGKQMTLTKCKRSDDTLFNLCMDVENIDISIFGKKECLLNVAFTNRTVNRINEKYNIEREESVLVNDWWLYPGQRLMGNRTDKETGIIKNKDYYIKKIRRGSVVFKDGMTLSYDDLERLMVLAYCITCHKSQGDTFKEEYGIYEWHLMSSEMKYVALSRGTCIENINIL